MNVPTMNLRSSPRIVSALALVVALTATASAQTITPNATYDDDDFDLADGQCDADPVLPGPQCTLRAAFQHAQAVGGAWTIQLGAQTYVLTRVGTDATSAAGDLDVFSSGGLVVQGAGLGTIIDASGLAGGGGPDRVLEIVGSLPAGITVELRDLTLRGGRAGGLGGGGILHEGGRLVLANVDIVDCQALSSGGSGGGGIRTNKVVDATGGSLAQCVAGSPLASGGGILAKAGAQLTFNGTSFGGNSAGQSGGNIRVDSGSAAAFTLCSIGNGTATSGGGVSCAGGGVLNQCTLLGNAATGAGGGVDLAATGFLGLDETILDNNSAQSGAGVNIVGGGSLTARGSTWRNNHALFLGGGISSGGSFTIERSTFSGNEAGGSGGGGLNTLGSSPQPNVLNLCTLSGNRATNGSGGGIRVGGATALEISACTIVKNSALNDGAGIHSEPGLSGPVPVKSSLLFDNRLLNGLPRNCGGMQPGSAGPNLDSDGTCLFPPSCLSGTTFLPLDPLIGPLALNGGPTETHALLGCSAAIDAGDCNSIAGVALTSDQRAFPRVGNCDLGAFEAQPGIQTSEIEAYCFGTASMCPCGIGGAPGHGCPSSVQPGGGLLTGAGLARVSCDSVVLTATSLTNSSALLFQGTALLNGGLGVPFGDGLRCVAGTVIRIGTMNAVGGTVQWPAAGGLPLSTAPLVPPSGGQRYYQVWYRNAAVFCTPFTFNLTNGVRIYWCP
jgi:hypothetical protein